MRPRKHDRLDKQYEEENRKRKEGISVEMQHRISGYHRVYNVRGAAETCKWDECEKGRRGQQEGKRVDGTHYMSNLKII
jgi:hypothetical protein